MPFTQQEKNKICRFSGWPLQSLVPNTIFFNDYFNQWILTIEYDDDMLTQIRTFIERIDNIDASLIEATKRLSLRSVGHNEVTYNENEISELRSERRRVVREMMKSMNIPHYN